MPGEKRVSETFWVFPTKMYCLVFYYETFDLWVLQSFDIFTEKIKIPLSFLPCRLQASAKYYLIYKIKLDTFMLFLFF